MLVLIGLYFLKCTKFDQLILKKIIKIVATRCQILTLKSKCTKIDFCWGLGEFTALAGTGGEGTGHSTCLPPRFDNPGYGPGVFNPSPRGGPNQWLNYSDRRAGSMKKNRIPK